MTDLLRDLRPLAEKAAESPWRHRPKREGDPVAVVTTPRAGMFMEFSRDADAAFIAYVGTHRAAIIAVLEEAGRLREAAEQMLARGDRYFESHDHIASGSRANWVAESRPIRAALRGSSE